MPLIAPQDMSPEERQERAYYTGFRQAREGVLSPPDEAGRLFDTAACWDAWARGVLDGAAAKPICAPQGSQGTAFTTPQAIVACFGGKQLP